MRSMMYLQKECISPELLCHIVAPLSIDALKECVEYSEKYKEIKDYRDLDKDLQNTIDISKNTQTLILTIFSGAIATYEDS